MTKRTYDRIANGCCLAAAGSAIFFDRAGEWQWGVGAIGILAGLIAAVTYFYNQWHREERVLSAEEADTIDPPLPFPLSGGKEAGRVVVRDARGQEEREGFQKTPRRVHIVSLAPRPVHVKVGNWTPTVRVIRSTHNPWRLINSEVVKMAKQLPQHEFEITQEGKVIVRPAGKQKRGETAERAQVEEQAASWPPPTYQPLSKTVH